MTDLAKAHIQSIKYINDSGKSNIFNLASGKGYSVLEIANIFKKMSFTTSQIGARASLVDTDKMTHQDSAKKWLADNEAVWKPWTK